MQTVKCKTCKAEFQARKADVKRGRGKFCSKECKARWQAYRLRTDSEQVEQKSDEQKTPNPGSPEAQERGCICPTIDNGHGKGYLGDWEKFGFVINAECPLHGSGKK